MNNMVLYDSDRIEWVLNLLAVPMIACPHKFKRRCFGCTQ